MTFNQGCLQYLFPLTEKSENSVQRRFEMGIEGRNGCDIKGFDDSQQLNCSVSRIQVALSMTVKMSPSEITSEMMSLG